MDQPHVAGTSPIGCDLESGKNYAWCSCGLSENQPFCDGKHAGTEFKPVVFRAEQSETVYFCTCKQTCDQPRCDGSHNTVSPPEGPG